MSNTSINISLPDTLKKYIKDRATEEGYSTPSDYIRDLVRKDRHQKAQQVLEQLLLEGINSGSKEMTENEWQKLRKKIRTGVAKNVKNKKT